MTAASTDGYMLCLSLDGFRKMIRLSFLYL